MSTYVVGESVCNVDSVEDADVTSPWEEELSELKDDVELTSVVSVDCFSVDMLTVVASVAFIASVAIIASVAFDTVDDDVDGIVTPSVVFPLDAGVDVSVDDGPFLSTSENVMSISLFSANYANTVHSRI